MFSALFNYAQTLFIPLTASVGKWRSLLVNMFIIKLRNNINKSIKSNKFSEKMFIKVGHTNKLYRVICNKMQMNPENLVCYIRKSQRDYNT